MYNINNQKKKIPNVFPSELSQWVGLGRGGCSNEPHGTTLADAGTDEHAEA